MFGSWSAPGIPTHECPRAFFPCIVVLYAITPKPFEVHALLPLHPSLSTPHPTPCPPTRPGPRGGVILVGDLMKSLTLLMYTAAEGSLEVRARDLDSKWVTQLAALDDDTYALADNGHNLVGGARREGGGKRREMLCPLRGGQGQVIRQWLASRSGRGRLAVQLAVRGRGGFVSLG